VFNAADRHALLVDQVTPADVQRRYFAAPTRGPKLREADLEAARIEVTATGTRVELCASPLAEQLGGVLHTRMVGEVFGENAMAAALAAMATGVPADAIVRGIADCPIVPGRFEVVVHGDDRPTIVVDYAHTPDALARTCASASTLAGAHGRVLVVFGAGGGASADKREPMGEAVGRGAALAIVTNDNPRDEDPDAIAAMLVAGLERVGGNHEVELDRARAIARAVSLARPGDVVVIAGKGHESGQRLRGHTLPFSDADVARSLFPST
jgi:UDP-N-acetylmuramoyl-L-alanyl-D-glutamate--2,6-diaminopimelate ligase